MSPFDDKKDESADETRYRSLVGALLYIGGSTRPDILCSTNLLSRYLGKPSKRHF
jgi:hypothetical protein